MDGGVRGVSLKSALWERRLLIAWQVWVSGHVMSCLRGISRTWWTGVESRWRQTEPGGFWLGPSRCPVHRRFTVLELVLAEAQGRAGMDWPAMWSVLALACHLVCWLVGRSIRQIGRILKFHFKKEEEIKPKFVSKKPRAEGVNEKQGRENQYVVHAPRGVSACRKSLEDGGNEEERHRGPREHQKRQER
ncbi:hypothetical protein NDU88_000956 [Pleurodeles waltl]|uniref:Transmembrane protein n=1 Tax=Pleurodeles waltl TaxID=8319 RepID=A0AAV7SY65_PLEWA|nr:hypothetical protein NDU88_000956 [Pleurodeles waltl]